MKMDRATRNIPQDVQVVHQFADLALVELGDLQLALVGGCCGETIL
jgi:hypothetical protein